MGDTASRIFVKDIRSDSSYLRVTWHAQSRAVVVSLWDDRVCLASTAIGLGDARLLIELLVAALAEAALSPAGPSAAPASLVQRLRRRALERIRPHLAQVVVLRAKDDERT